MILQEIIDALIESQLTMGSGRWYIPGWRRPDIVPCLDGSAIFG